MRQSATGHICCAFACLLVASQFAAAQTSATVSGKNAVPAGRTDPSRKANAPPTFIEFDLLQVENNSGLYAQQWLKILTPLDISFRVHRADANDKLDMTERLVGNQRHVTVVGMLDRTGKITFKDRSFELTDTEKLKEWIQELRTFGIRGDPTSQPLWGLTKEQFTQFYEGLTRPIDFNTEGLSLKQVVAKLPLPKTAPVHWTADASDLAARRGDGTKMKLELHGFSSGTVLAIALRENGLAYRPQRIASGDVELLIEQKNPKQEQWPVGWPTQRQISKALPKFHTIVPVELSDVPLSDVINAIATLSETPIFIDYGELESKKIDLEKINVSFPKKMTTWGIALNRLIVPQRLTREFWQDEAGHVFVWITTSHAGRSKESD